MICRTMLLLIVLSWTNLAEAQLLPTVYLLYPAPDGTIFDRTCGATMKTEIDSKWVQETVRRAPDFQAQWDEQGPTYMTAAFAEIGRKFPFRQMQAVLTVCPVGSISHPLMINVRAFLSTAQKPAPAWLFSEIVFHELMHHYTMPVNATSALRNKYSAEPGQTLNHLHVMALEKFVLVKLGRSAELKYVDEHYRTGSPATYKRAWEIVNDIEGHEAFIRELKLLPQ
jgi:hypothetical protein